MSFFYYIQFVLLTNPVCVVQRDFILNLGCAELLDFPTIVIKLNYGAGQLKVLSVVGQNSCSSNNTRIMDSISSPVQLLSILFLFIDQMLGE